MRQKPALTSDDVQKMAAACRAEALKNKWNVSIAIVDDGGYLLHFERLDGAAPLTSRVAVGKAESAALSQKPTKLWEDLVKERPAFAKAPISTPLQGGVPIMVQGDCVGGIGASGARGDQDEQVASAGVAALAG